MPQISYRSPGGGYAPLLGGFSEAQADARYINLNGDTFAGQAYTNQDVFGATDAVDKAYVDSMVPPGMMGAVNSTTAPAGWLICNGQQVASATYPDLYAVIGVTYGGTAASFALPNLKARIIVGMNTAEGEFNAVGKVGGETYHTLSAAEMPNSGSGRLAWHGGGSRTSFYNASGGSFWQAGYIAAYGRPQYWVQSASNIGGSSHNWGGGGLGHENRQWITILNHVIKT